MKIKNNKNKIYSLKVLLKKLFAKLDRRTKFKLLILLLMLFLSYGAETFSFLSIVSFLTIITSEDFLTANEFTTNIADLLNISNSNHTKGQS